MAIYHVLLNGSGTSGNGSTWNDDSSGTAAYIGQAGLSTIFNAAVANDVIYIKGTDTTSTGALTLGTGTDGADFVDRPVRVIGCKSATTNTGVNVDNNDVIPGLMTGDTDEAWNDGDMPYFSINSASADLIINHGWWYGVRMKSSDNINMVSSTDQHLHFEECWLEVTGTGDYIQFGSSQCLGTITGHHSKFLRAGSAIFYLGCTHAKFKHCTFSSPAGQEIFDGANNKGFAEFDGCTFLGGVTTIISLAGSNGYFKFNNCKFPTSWAIAAGTSTRRYDVHNYGGSNASAATSSIQKLQYWNRHGQVNEETTVVRTGGADDGDTGGFAWDMSPNASRTIPGVLGLESPDMLTWVEGDGTSKTATVYFCSDTGNTNTADWQNDEVWLDVSYVSETGDSAYDHGHYACNLLATPVDVTDDATSTWGSGGVRGQKMAVTIAPDFHGWIRGVVSFAPDANADTIYVDPAIYIT